MTTIIPARYKELRLTLPSYSYVWVYGQFIVEELRTRWKISFVDVTGFYHFRNFVVLKSSHNRTVEMVLNRYEWEKLPLAHVSKPKSK